MQKLLSIFIFIGTIWANSILFTQIPKSLTAEECMKPFYHGVASGDPLHDRVIIWTRVTPSVQNNQPVVVSWKMATDTAMTQVVQSGSFLTNASRDYTVKVDVTNLQPDTWYYYEFYAEGKSSIQGRTKTTPLPTVEKDSVRFAVVSCANLEAGYFNVYGALAQRQDFDAVICLGDYYYEYEKGGYSPNAQTNRFFEPITEILTLDDYRKRHSVYRLDPDLRRLHQNYPWFCIWDDHEFANDAWIGGAENHSSSEGDWTLRKNVAKQAYFEWIPVREKSVTNPYEIYRAVSFGKLVDLLFLDTRIQGRSQQVSITSSAINDANRKLLGTDQFNWLISKLNNSSAKYKVLAQQVMIAPLQVFGVAVNADQWDGYPVERTQLFNHIVTNNINNVVVLTGDIHTSWASNLKNSLGNVGVEFVTPSVTSPALETISAVSYVGAAAIKAANSHIQWVDLSNKGFIIVDFNKTRVQSDWYFIQTIDDINLNYSWAASYYANDGQNALTETNTVTLPRNTLFTDLPQLCPRPFETPTEEPEEEEEENLSVKSQSIVLLGIYPNPVEEQLTLHFSNQADDELSFRIVSLDGKTVKTDSFLCKTGAWNYEIRLDDLNSGYYKIILQSKSSIVQGSFIKK